MREEEIRMLEEFRRRKQQGALDLEETASADTFGTDHPYEAHMEESVRALYEGEDFIICMLERDSTTLITKLNRINHFRYLIFVGNGNGVISYGRGKGKDFEAALTDALRQAKKNLIVLNLDHFYSFTQPLKAKFNGFKMEVYPRDHMNAWGHPTLAYFFCLAGVTNVKYVLHSRNISNYAMVYCFFKIMTAMQTPKMLSEENGEKIYRNVFLPFQYKQRNDVGFH